jgi:glycerol transport system ATP-binding protein
LSFEGVVAVTELSGSKSFVHVDVGVGAWVCLVEGAHDWAPGQTVNVNVDPAGVFAFDADGGRIRQTYAAEVTA